MHICMRVYIRARSAMAANRDHVKRVQRDLSFSLRDDKADLMLLKQH